MCEEIAPNINTEVREYRFKGIHNFRDLGGYKVNDGKIVAWNRLYRSAELRFMNSRDVFKLKHEIRPASVIDLRDATKNELSEKERLEEMGIRYYNVPVVLEPQSRDGNAGEVFLSLTGGKEFGKKVIEVLGILSDSKNLPAIIHCNAGKNRTGVMTAIILGILGVSDDDIISDYLLSAPYMAIVRQRLNDDPAMAAALAGMPEYIWSVEAESIRFFLKALKDKYGSFRDYGKAQGADESLFSRVENALTGARPGPSGNPE